MKKIVSIILCVLLCVGAVGGTFALAKKLKEVGYNGVWMYELGFDEPKTLKRVRALTCEDFATNARCIFEGKYPPSFVKK